MATKITTRVLADDAVTDAKLADAITSTTQAASDNTTKVATTAYVTTAIANLSDSAPSTLNTLNELAAALGDDANYATTTTNAIAAKLPLAGGTMTGVIQPSSANAIDLGANGNEFRTLYLDTSLIASNALTIATGTDLTVDVAGELKLDADGGNITLQDGGTAIGQFQLNDTNHLKLVAKVSDADIFLQGNDGGSIISALRLDMSDAGTATFNHDVKLPDNGQLLFGAGSDLTIYHDASDSYIKDTGTGNLLIQYSDLYFGDGTNHDVVFRDSGNIGIGTTNPQRLLHLQKTGSDAAVLRIDTNNQSHVAGIELMSGHGDWGVYNSDTVGDALEFRDDSAGVTRMIILSDGSVGIGNTSPGALLDVNNGTAADNRTVAIFEGQGNGSSQASGGQYVSITRTGPISSASANVCGGLLLANGSSVTAANCGIRGTYEYTNGRDIQLFTTSDNSSAPTNKMIIKGNGRIQCMTASTASGALNLLGEAGNSYDAIQFFHNSSTAVGRIRTGSSSTAFTSLSDYRLKENVDYTWDATTRLKQLKPARFNWIADDTNTLLDGFLAHEVSSIVPEAIIGEKDATETYTDDEGNEQTRPDYQGIDHSKLVPLLVKTIQELEARLTAGGL